MDAVRSFGSLKLCQCCLQGNISWLTSENKNYALRRWKECQCHNGRVKSTNSSSELSNKGCPLILHKTSNNANIDLPAGERIRKKALQLSAMFRQASDRYRPRARPSTRKNFLANVLKQELPIWRECQWKIQTCKLFI